MVLHVHFGAFVAYAQDDVKKLVAYSRTFPDVEQQYATKYSLPADRRNALRGGNDADSSRG